jgi:predicted Zn-dependent protease
MEKTLMSIKYVPKKMLENNVTPHIPGINFLYLFGTVIAISALIFYLLGLTADWLVTRLSEETEVELGNQFISSYEEQIIRQDKRISYLQKLLDELPISGETIRLSLNIRLLNDETINAAAFLGGYVFINTGLLKVVESENELAFVLAHEIGHFKARDPLKTLGRSLVYWMASQVMGLGTYLDPISFTRQFTALSYDRQQERQADKYALECIYYQYGHVEHAIDLFTRLEEKELKSKSGISLPKISQYFSTHPSSLNRKAYLTKIAKKNGWATKGKATPLPEGIACPDMDSTSTNCPTL